MSQAHFCFVSGKGTRNAVFYLGTIAERYIEVQNNLYMCFVDYKQAFDKVKHEKMFKLLREIHLDRKDLRLIQNLYWSQKAAVKVRDELSEWQES